jgi:hypothetical protein
MMTLNIFFWCAMTVCIIGSLFALYPYQRASGGIAAIFIILIIIGLRVFPLNQ